MSGDMQDVIEIGIWLALIFASATIGGWYGSWLGSRRRRAIHPGTTIPITTPDPRHYMIIAGGETRHRDARGKQYVSSPERTITVALNAATTRTGEKGR